jgi:diguanylate cyclase (GGDEF)-like protein/PAS domain S-box-containing protein
MSSNFKISMLYVEDDLFIKSRLSKFLATKSDNLLEATNGKDGLEVFKKHLPDIVITDIDMPMMNGIDMIKEMRKISQKTKIIILTAYTKKEYLLKATELNIFRFILKPIELSTIKKSIDNIVEIVNLEKNNEKHQQKLQTIIDSQSSIVVLTNGEKLIQSNKYFLDFFNFKDINEFNLTNNCVCEFFEKNDPRYFYSKKTDSNYNWLEDAMLEIEKHGALKVKIFDHIFLLQINHTNEDSEYIVTLSDITVLEKTKEKLKSYIKIVNENIITSTTDANGIITDVSNAFCRVSGYTKEELIGNTHKLVRVPNFPAEIYREMWANLKAGKAWKGEIKNRDKFNNEYWVSSYIEPMFDSNTNEIIGYTSIRQNITDKKIIEKLSITDSLTGLYNRRFFNQKIQEEISRAKRENQFLSFMMFDVDFFKLYNDTYGHQMGDEVLREIGSLLNRETKRASDFAFRLGGEEFAILYTNSNIAQSKSYAEKIRALIEDLGIRHEKNSVSKYITVSIGLFVKQASEISTNNQIYKITDEALYKAKKNGRNRIELVE